MNSIKPPKSFGENLCDMLVFYKGVDLYENQTIY